MKEQLTPEQIKQELIRIYNAQTDLFHVVPPYKREMIQRNENAFIFQEDWEPGDKRFKPKPNPEYRWMMWPRDEGYFRLIITVDRFSLTLPYVVTGIM